MAGCGDQGARRLPCRNAVGGTGAGDYQRRAGAERHRAVNGCDTLSGFYCSLVLFSEVMNGTHAYAVFLSLLLENLAYLCYNRKIVMSFIYIVIVVQ